jgi:hypothetical protein
VPRSPPTTHTQVQLIDALAGPRLRIRPLDGGAVLHAEAKPGVVVRPGDTWGEYS